MSKQLDLSFGTADSPRGIFGGADVGLPAPEPCEVPKPKPKESNTSPTVTPTTMEMVADGCNLRAAFEKVASNRGAPGPDHQSVDDVRGHIGKLLPKLRQALLTGDYQPGEIRRVWTPKSGCGERGLGIPNVVDRIVQQAVLQVLRSCPSITWTVRACLAGRKLSA